MKLKHIAYYTDNIDILFFSEQTADDIVNCAKNNYGGLYRISDVITYTKDEFEEGVLRFTTDGKYAVSMDLPIDLSVLNNPNVCDFFIDIYEVIKEDEEELPTEKLCAKKAVSGQIVNMIINNIINENGNESFEGWCEDGVVFDTAYPNSTKEFREECEKLMKEVAPLVDKLTYNFLAEY